jgi:hypothetical protein
MNERLNLAMLPFGVKPQEMPVDFTIGVFGLLASIISFAVAKIQIKFGYFFYVSTAMVAES